VRLRANINLCLLLAASRYPPRSRSMARAASDAARIDAGAKLAINPHAWVFASFDGECSRRSQSYAGKAGAKMSW
jgi:uncharacterized protein with beta-barrel porin domain